MNWFLKILVAMLGLATQSASAADCPWQLRLTRADGSSLCFDDLPISTVVDRRWNESVSSVAKNMPNFVLAVAKDAACEAVAIEPVRITGGAAAAGPLDSRELALASCSSRGCDCEIGIENGRIVAARLDPLARATDLNAARQSPGQVEQQRASDAAVAANCPIRLRLRDAHGGLICLTDLSIAKFIDPRWNRTVEGIAAQLSAFVVATSKDLTCRGVAIEAPIGNVAILGDFWIRDRALNACHAQGCDCEISIEGGRVQSMGLRAAAPATPSVASTSQPALNNVPDRPAMSPANQRRESGAIPPVPTQKQTFGPVGVAGEKPVEASGAKPAGVHAAPKSQAQAQSSSVAVPAAMVSVMPAVAASGASASADSESAQREIERLRDELAKAQELVRAQIGQLAAMNKSDKRRKALVIGNDSYTSIERLVTARSDARAISNALTNVNFAVTLHTDLAERPMKQALRDFRATVEAGDEVLIYFAGHGVQIGGANFLLPTDIQGQSEEQVREEAVQLQRILDDMTSRRAGFTLAVIDACRNNPFESVGRSIGGGGGLAPTAAATGQMVIFSAGTGQKALDRLSKTDRDSNSVFARVFLKEMNKPGVPVDRVMRSVRQQVVGLARSVGVDQTPALYDQVVGDFYFVPPGAR